MNKEKIHPLEPQEWSADLADVLGFLGKPLNIHRMMAHHPDLLKAWMPFRNHVVGSSSLSPRQRELIILRTAHNCQADYEWQHHVERGLAAGLSQGEIDRVREGPCAGGWQADEVAVLKAVDECHANSCISTETLTQLNQHFSVQQQLDMTVTTGMYMTLAMIIKTHDVPMED